MSISRKSPTATALRHNLLVMVTAALICFPCLRVGIPETGDASTHAMYQYHFTNQFWKGDLYPRWIAGANKGFGSPIFLAQYSLPYFVTALLRSITWFSSTDTREARELGLYCFLALAASGVAARAWFRNHYSALASTVAAIAYISFPYIVGQTIFTRVSIGELTTFVWMPLILALCDRMHPTRLWVVSAAGVAFALLILSNILTAALFAPVMVIYSIVAWKRLEMSFVKLVAPVLFSLLIGVGVAATYVFPLLAYHKLLDADAVPANHPYAELGRQLLGIAASEVSAYRITLPAIVIGVCVMLFVLRYVLLADLGPATRRVLLLMLGLGATLLIPGLGPKLTQLSGLKVSGFDSYNGFAVRMLVTVLFTLGLGIVAYCRISARKVDPRERFLLVVSCSAFVLMLPWSAPLWKVFPEFGSILQFPWRFCAVLCVASSGLCAAAIDDCLRHETRGKGAPSLVVIIAFLLVIIGAGNFFWAVTPRYTAPFTTHVDMTRGVDPMYPTYVPARSLAGFANDVGASLGTWDMAPTPVVYGVRSDIVRGQGSVSVVRTGPRTLVVSAHCQTDSRVRIGQLFMPLWRIVAVTQSAGTESLSSSPDGLIEVSLGPGQHEFELLFDGGFPERAGTIVTLASILFVAVGSVFSAFSALGPKPSIDVREHSFSS